MKVSKLVLTLGFVAISSLSSVAMAQAHKPMVDPVRQAHHQPKMWLSGIDLTQEQREQIKDIMQKHKAEKPAKDKAKNERKALHDLLAQDNFDEVNARLLIEAEQEKQVERRVKALKVKHEVLQVLTDEQRAELAKKKHKHKRAHKPVKEAVTQ